MNDELRRDAVRSLTVARNVLSPDPEARKTSSDVIGMWWVDDPVPDRQGRILGEVHLLAVPLEPSEDIREGLLLSISDLVETDVLPPRRAAELQAWLDVTGTTRAEVDYVEVFRAAAATVTDGPVLPLDPEASHRMVQFLRRLLAADVREREEAARTLDLVLDGAPPAVAGAVVGVLAMLVVVEDDRTAREHELRSLVWARDHDLLDPADLQTVSSLTALGPDEDGARAILDRLRAGS